MRTSFSKPNPVRMSLTGGAGWLPLLLVLLLATGGGVRAAGEASDRLLRPPAIFPDYRDVVVPPNLAPLNFRIEEPGSEYLTRIRSTSGSVIELRRKSPDVQIPLPAWRKLLAGNSGEALLFDVSVRSPAGGWNEFPTITNQIARDVIDSHLVYRLLRPAHSLYGKLGIYQRDLESFDETPILENERFNGGCVNCHTFNQNRPELMALHIRQQGTGNPMLLWRTNEVVQVAKTAGYLSWHPSGRLLAYSSNRFMLFFHTQGETRDVFDSASDLGIYRLDQNVVVVPPALARPERQETWPCWSPNGRHLYFCSAPRARLERFDRVRYDLMRVAFDLDADQWGEPEVLVSATETRLSATEPRVAPDGESVLCCLLPYGNFPPYQPAADLYQYTVDTRKLHKLDFNSDQCDSYPCWSSTGRWIVFSSKRRDGLFARPYFSHRDDVGRFSKPLLLPQRDPAFYDSFINNFNRPELVTGPVPVSSGRLVEGLYHPRTLLKPAQDSPPAAPDQPFTAQGTSERGQ